MLFSQADEIDVPYGSDVPRWTDPQPLPADYDYGGKEYTKDALYCAQPSRHYTQNSTPTCKQC